MEIQIADIPEEGLHVEGEFSPSIFDLPPDDAIRPVSPIRYCADLYALDETVVMTGWLRGQFQLQCGSCLEFFDYDADFSDWSSEVDLEPKQRSFNFRDIVREDFLLGLPSYPRCDDFDDDRECPRGDLLSRDDLPLAEDPIESGNSEDPGNVWGVLDELT
jgi:uncharacterized metal-binding protein YceD (DUF177 family)